MMVKHLRETAENLTGSFQNYFDRVMQEAVERGLSDSGADEGTIWLLDATSEYLVPVFNSGPNASEFVGKFRQSVNSGMISMVVATEQSICENDVHRNQRQDRTLDGKLGVQTRAMIATPVYFAGELRGVISAVQLQSSGDDPAQDVKPGFRCEQLQSLQRTAALLARLIEHKILTICITQQRGS